MNSVTSSSEDVRTRTKIGIIINVIKFCRAKEAVKEEQRG